MRRYTRLRQLDAAYLTAARKYRRFLGSLRSAVTACVEKPSSARRRELLQHILTREAECVQEHGKARAAVLAELEELTRKGR
jgi:hypothetical protein